MRLMRSALGAAMMVIILASIALTFDLNDLKKLKEPNECVECDLSGADLVRANLEDAIIWIWYLWKANLEGANLKGANFLRADIRSAKIKDDIICNTTMPDGSVNDIGC